MFFSSQAGGACRYFVQTAGILESARPRTYRIGSCTANAVQMPKGKKKGKGAKANEKGSDAELEILSPRETPSKNVHGKNGTFREMNNPLAEADGRVTHVNPMDTMPGSPLDQLSQLHVGPTGTSEVNGTDGEQHHHHYYGPPPSQVSGISQDSANSLLELLGQLQVGTHKLEPAPEPEGWSPRPPALPIKDSGKGKKGSDKKNGEKGKKGADSSKKKKSEDTKQTVAMAASYKCIMQTIVREGAGMDSKKAGVLKLNEVIDVLTTKTMDSGVMRVKFSSGWVSATSGAGLAILQPSILTASAAAAARAPPEPELLRSHGKELWLNVGPKIREEAKKGKKGKGSKQAVYPRVEVANTLKPVAVSEIHAPVKVRVDWARAPRASALFFAYEKPDVSRWQRLAGSMCCMPHFVRTRVGLNPTSTYLAPMSEVTSITSVSTEWHGGESKEEYVQIPTTAEFPFVVCDLTLKLPPASPQRVLQSAAQYV